MDSQNANTALLTNWKHYAKSHKRLLLAIVVFSATVAGTTAGWLDNRADEARCAKFGGHQEIVWTGKLDYWKPCMTDDGAVIISDSVKLGMSVSPRDRLSLGREIGL